MLVMLNILKFAMLVMCLGLYFIPFGVALWREKQNTIAIFLLNLTLGWTYIGWAVALVWAACKEDKCSCHSEHDSRDCADL